jgi:hypothetical protein
MSVESILIAYANVRLPIPFERRRKPIEPAGQWCSKAPGLRAANATLGIVNAAEKIVR